MTVLGITAALLLACALAWGLPEWRRRRIWNNQRDVFQAMKLLTSAEAVFQEKDADGNQVMDFWTGDVAGLHRYQLIPRELAEADAAPLNPLVPSPVPYRGYYFRALLTDGSEMPPESYRQATDKTSGNVHHLTKFGFIAYPAVRGGTGNRLYVVNENRTIFPREATAAPPTNFPTDNELKSFYSKE